MKAPRPSKSLRDTTMLSNGLVVQVRLGLSNFLFPFIKGGAQDQLLYCDVGISSKKTEGGLAPCPTEDLHSAVQDANETP